MSRCRACNGLLNFQIDDDFCPECFGSYTENLDSIIPEDMKDEVNDDIQRKTKKIT